MVYSILILGADRNALFPLPARGSLFFPIRGLGSGEADASLLRLSVKQGVWSRTNRERGVHPQGYSNIPVSRTEALKSFRSQNSNTSGISASSQDRTKDIFSFRPRPPMEEPISKLPVGVHDLCSSLDLSVHFELASVVLCCLQ